MQHTKNIDTIYCGTEVWNVLNTYLEKVKYSNIYILTDSNTRNYCLPAFIQYTNLNSQPTLLEMPQGEENKTIETCLQLWNQLSESKADRNSLLINLGGGVISDLGGFVASTFKRGIHFINIPTSLLAMVDAAVGGKNGVDLGSIKNQIGTINAAQLVLIDTRFLKTLPKAHITSGVAEMLKHGIIASEKYFSNVLNMSPANSNFDSLIWESVEIKNHIVAEDPSETGLRKTLNYGHTLGHAIESYCLQNSERKTLLHGESIAIGMILATFISSEIVSFPKKLLYKISSGILSMFEKVPFTKTDVNEICKLLIYDKKNSGGKVYFVLLEDFNKPVINCEVPNALIHKAFKYYENF